jgi:hypothetical protein
VVTKFDRLARSLPDARGIADELTARQVKLNLGGLVHDPTGPCWSAARCNPPPQPSALAVHAHR